MIQPAHVTAGGELAAIINTQNVNLSSVHPRKVVFFRSGTDTPRYVHIFSRHYEPLYQTCIAIDTLWYPLLFPHGTPGWGWSLTFTVPERVREHDESDLLGDEPVHILRSSGIAICSDPVVSASASD
jgi:hypothetical protein